MASKIMIKMFSRARSEGHKKKIMQMFSKTPTRPRCFAKLEYRLINFSLAASTVTMQCGKDAGQENLFISCHADE